MKKRIIIGSVIFALLIGLTFVFSAGTTTNIDLTIDKDIKAILADINITDIQTSDVLPDYCTTKNCSCSQCSDNLNWGRVAMQTTNGFTEWRHMSMGMPYSLANDSVKELKTRYAVTNFTKRIAYDEDTQGYMAMTTSASNIQFTKKYNLK